jgi:SAM-dependent methyltransferase
MTAALRLYAAALSDGGALAARHAGGRLQPLAVDRWLGPARGPDTRLLQRAAGPVLDVGCGPGRHVAALAARGVPALGLDVSATAAAIARERGAAVLCGSVFGPVPGAGTWRTALLLDGNVGIGGDPEALMRRLGALLARDGRILCETDAPGTGLERATVRLDDGTLVSDAFPWARVGIEALPAVARAAGFSTLATWDDEGRWFAELARSRP